MALEDVFVANSRNPDLGFRLQHPHPLVVAILELHIPSNFYYPQLHRTGAPPPVQHRAWAGLRIRLQYLQDCNRCVVHGYIKPANIMLDASRNAKLGDFGLARLVDHGAERRTTVGLHRSGVRQQPQALRRVGRVQLRRGATGDRPRAPALLSFVRGMYDRGNVLDAADERRNGVFDERQMQRVLVIGLW
uniref:Cytokinin receptor-like n=1 Tax=Oryza sativa subsp. japonica TaxID=39947 RepID=Q6ESM7_ORYSJ|nr:cytokinin receptor-like [Oryza sativa Japonica Group]